MGQPFILSFISETLAAALTGSQTRGETGAAGPGMGGGRAEYGKGRGAGGLSGTQRQSLALGGARRAPRVPGSCDPSRPSPTQVIRK